MILGAIGDDFTGSSDLGLTLSAGGMRTVQYVGIPEGSADTNVEAGIIALKTRTVPATEAVRRSLDAYAWLRAQGCKQILFKYCSTFDSRPEGNIGPVIDALIEASGTDAPVVVCPAFPATGRTVYHGHLFVGDRLLSESGMEAHPLTPMTDPDIRRWLERQTKRSVGLLALNDLRAGDGRNRLLAETEAGRQIVVCDAVADTDLLALGKAAEGFDLLTGGSGIALGLPPLLIGPNREPPIWHGESGSALALAGSCSKATRAQIARHRLDGGSQRRIDVAALIDGKETVDAVLTWVQAQKGLPLVYTSDDPAQVAAAQRRFGVERSANAVEGFFADLARAVVDSGIRRLITAGGETSGAVVEALDVSALEIGPAIDPGVPALRVENRALVLALKSGNFGSPDFFEKADAALSVIRARSEPDRSAT